MEMTEFMDTLLKICGAITVLIGTCGAIYGVYRWFRKPSVDNFSRLTEHDNAIKDLQDKAAKDYESIQEIKTMQATMIQALIAIMDHQIYGNHVEKMEQAKKDLIKLVTEN